MKTVGRQAITVDVWRQGQGVEGCGRRPERQPARALPRQGTAGDDSRVCGKKVPPLPLITKLYCYLGAPHGIWEFGIVIFQNTLAYSRNISTY